MQTWTGYQKGVNLGGWFSQCDYSKERFDTFITEKDMEKIKAWGADHVRLPVDYNLVQTEEGEFKEEGFAYIQKALGWCQKVGLNAVIDLHKTAGYSFDPAENQSGFFDSPTYQERFYGLWEEMAARFGALGDAVAFELLNEVTEKEVSEKWNNIAQTCIARIRKIAPHTKILLGGYWNNSFKAVKDLPLPPDKNIVYNFHCYAPLLFTHQGAGWVEKMPPDLRLDFSSCTTKEINKIARETFPEDLMPLVFEDVYDGKLGEEYFEAQFAEAIAVADDRNVPLYCGEYGVIENAAPADELKWYKAIHAVFERHGIGRASWSYKEMNFGLQDERLSGVIDELIKFL